MARQPSRRTDRATKLKQAVLPLSQRPRGVVVVVVVVSKAASGFISLGGHVGPPIIIIIIEASNLDEGQGLGYQPLSELYTVEYLIRLTHSPTCLRYNIALSPQTNDSMQPRWRY